MAKRMGSVIVFKPGVTKAQAAKALASLAAVVEFPETTFTYERVGAERDRKVKMVKVPFTHDHAVHEYEDEHWTPAWYIP
jgi:hypothetical protein